MPRWPTLPPLTEFQRELVREHVGLAFDATAKECRSGSIAGQLLGFDEALSVAFEALVCGARSYDPERQGPGGFAAYIYRGLCREIREAARRLLPLARTTPYFEDVLACPWAEDPAILAERAEECERLLRLVRTHLSRVERVAIEQTIMGDSLDREVAASLGIDRSSVTDARRRAIGKLQEAVGV